MPAPRYIRIVLGLVFIAVAAIMLTNWLVDPYELRAPGTRTPTFDGVTEAPGAFLRKAYAISSIKPRTVILGTSRAAAALSPAHSAFSPDDLPVMNVALGAASIRQIRLLLIHANETAQVRKAIIGLDLESFLGEGRSDFDPAALRGNDESEPLWLNLARTACSQEMLRASVERVLALLTAESDRSSIRKAGRQDRFEEKLRNFHGQRGLVWVTEFTNFHSRLPELFPVWKAASAWGTDGRRADTMREFRALLTYARKHDIALHMFISPVHARYLEWYRRVGWWPLFEHWKRALAEALFLSGISARGQSFPLWDFSGFHAPATEPVPPLGDLKSRMHWYLESSHYSRALGDLILERILARPGAETSPLPSVLIEPFTLDRHIRSMRDDADRYRIAHPGETAEVEKMVRYLRRVARK